MITCQNCGMPTIGDNIICDDCRNDFADDFEFTQFIPCSECDGHPACEDFGCYYEMLSNEQEDERSVATKMPNEPNDGNQNNNP